MVNSTYIYLENPHPDYYWCGCKYLYGNFWIILCVG